MKRLITLLSLACFSAYYCGSMICPAYAENKDVNAGSEKKENRRLISLDFQNTPLSTVLEVMSMKTGNKFITDAEMARKTILFVLRDVTPEDALNALLDTYNLYYVRQPNTDIYIIKNRMGSEPIKTVTKIIPSYYAPANDLAAIIRTKLGPGGNIAVDQRSNSLIVSDVADGIEKIEQLVKQLDKPPLQVMLEAKIVDVKLTSNSSFGVNFDNVYRTGKIWVNPWKLGEASAMAANNISGTVPFTLEQDLMPETLFRSAYMPKGLGNSLQLSLQAGDYNISSTIGAEKSDVNGKVLSNPRLLVMNGQEASIDIVSQLPYTESTTQGTASPIATTSFKDVGIKLRVKPTINKDNTIILSVWPEQSFKTGEDKNGVPIINTSRANTVMMIKDGETAVIGGLIREDDSFSEYKVPLLGDIPILGYLFKNTVKGKTRSELTVFISAKIVEQQPEH